ncbi:AAA family ATPase [Sphingomonas changnyeongensis]|uniref:AAA family ATPase n=1 Tax=Sphingomonas changnyeongensis TaxID=2698679 RepID=A0A7Z2NXQ2_9SPHN|nr:AAA family ATPase [Sphingomonas changnyeongensis]QHL91159.1 AAA family ATPase [Sphingomonas changnyeongensis]
MARDTATARLSYLLDPYLPSRCVVGFYGRGGSAKSSSLASAAAEISHSMDASTLWVSVEELTDWIKVRHIKIGGMEGTLAVVAAVASKKDTQGRVVASSFNVYEHLEPAIAGAKAQFEGIYDPPRPLRLVVLDTAVGLTTWAKGESPNDDASVKRLLAYLQALAERHDVTIAIIGHSNKGKHDHFADTVAGASAWTNSPRLSFVHARDRREEFACVMQVAKSNLTQRFAASYTTEPVHTLHERAEGADSVLCRVNFGEIVWGEEDATELYEAATRRQNEDEEGEGGGGGHKPSVVSQVVTTVTQMVHTSAEPVTRDAVHARAGREFSRREWTKVDDMLAMASFTYKVAINRGTQNRVLYERMP